MSSSDAASMSTSGSTWAPGALAPDPAASSDVRMLLAQTRIELVLTLRRGESLLLTLIIPVLLLTLFSTVELVTLPAGSRVDFLAPGILALAVMSTAFTGLAIATGFERSYGVLKRLGATALPRWVLLAGKTLAVLAVEVLQVAVIVGVGLALGWRPAAGGLAAALLLVVLGTAAFAGLGLLMAGTLRAEATLAGANLVYLLLLVGGGIVFPLTAFGDGVASALRLLPVTALSDGLRATLGGSGLEAQPVLVLLVWSVLSLGAAARWFRWE